MAMHRVLLVEDDPDQAMLYNQVLALSGYDVIIAPDAEAALVSLADPTIDLALVDWDLPMMKGDELVGTIKQQYPPIRTVLYSNHLNVEEAARACGADAWFRKSEGIIALRELLAKLLQ